MNTQSFDFGFRLATSASSRSTHSRTYAPPSFSALVSRSIARCCNRLCMSAVSCTKNLFTVLPSILLMAWQGNGGSQDNASHLTYRC